MTIFAQTKPALTEHAALALSRQRLETLEDKYNALVKMAALENNPELDYDFSKERGEIFLAIALGEWEVDSGRWAIRVSELLGLDGEQFLKLNDGHHSFVQAEEATLFDDDTILEVKPIYRNPEYYVKEHLIISKKEKPVQEDAGGHSPATDEPGWLERTGSSEVTVEAEVRSEFAELSQEAHTQQPNDLVSETEKQAIRIVTQTQKQLKDEDKKSDKKGGIRGFVGKQRRG